MTTDTERDAARIADHAAARVNVIGQTTRAVLGDMLEALGEGGATADKWQRLDGLWQNYTTPARNAMRELAFGLLAECAEGLGDIRGGR